MKNQNKNLGNLSISALLNQGVDKETFQPWFEFCAQNNLLTLKVQGMFYMEYCRYWEDRNEGDSNIMDVKVSKRLLKKEEIERCRKMITEPREATIIEVFGHLNLVIFCEDFEVTTEPLKNKYPYLI